MKIDVNSSSTESVFSSETNTASSNKLSNVKNFSDLKAGDRFKATVTDITPNHVTLRLSSGASLNAKSLILPEARIGEESIFAVKENFKGQILLEMVKPDNNALQTNIVKEALSNATLAVTKENIDLVINLIKNNIPIDSESLRKATFLNFTDKNISIEKIIFLLQENFEATESNISILNRIMDKSLRLESSVNNIISGIIELDNPVVKRELINILLNRTASNTVNDTGSLKTQTSLGFVSDAIGNSNSGAIPIGKSDDMFIDNLLSKLSDGSPTEKRESLNILKNELSKSLYIDFGGNTQPKGHEIGKYFTRLANTLVAVSERLQTVLNSEQFQPASQATGSPEAQPGSVNTDDKLMGQITGLSGSIEEITSSLKFMNQINTFKEYMQIPFSINGEKNQGELYVFKNKKGAKTGTDQASVLISVDFDSLGHVECFINKVSKNLSFDFRTENDNIAEIIKRNVSGLFAALSEKGYKILGITYKKAEMETVLTDNPVNEETTIGEKRYAFDMRV